MSQLFVLIVYGMFSGCSGPIIGWMPDPYAPRYLYEVEMRCAGRHDIGTWRSHEEPFRMNEFFPARDLKVIYEER